jgi:hypothetical protein
MKPIPISAAEHIAKTYGYDQVVIIARKVDRPAGVGETAKQEIKGGKHCTTYGIDKANCDVAARIGNHLKFDVMNWAKDNIVHEDHSTCRPDWSKVYDGSNRDFAIAQQLLLVTRETLALSRSSIRQCNEQDYYHNRGAAERELTALLGDGEV